MRGYSWRDRIADENHVGGLEQALTAFDTGGEGVAIDHVDPGIDVPHPLEIMTQGGSDHHDRDPRRLLHMRSVPNPYRSL